MAPTTTTEYFPFFVKFSPEIRVEIWRQAYAQRGPQIVEIESCTANHEKYACRLCGREKGDPCCYHFENDQTLRCNHAKELKSHFSCNGIPHLQRRKNSAPSNILWVNRESRCEAQKIGMLQYRLSIYTRALATSTTTVPSSIPIYLDFAVDTLAVSTRTLLRGFCGRQLRGTEKIQRLIVLDFNENLVVLADVLQQFSGLKELYLARPIAAEVDSNTRLLSPGDLRRAAVTDLFGFLKLFRKQFNWLREQQYGHPVCNVEWIFAERNADGSLALVLPTSRYMTLGFTWSHQQDLGSYMGEYSESFRQEFCSLLRKWHQEWADEWAADWLAYYNKHPGF
jgi:hypothetical protein